MRTVPIEERAGYETFTCPYCDTGIESTCDMASHYDEGSEFRDVAYCNECDIKHSRTRTNVVEPEYGNDGFAITTRKETRDAYAEYECKYCGGMHERTEPAPDPFGAGWEHEEAEIGGYDETWLTCPCGEIHTYDLPAPGNPVECECGRTFKLVVTGEPRRRSRRRE